MLLFFGYVLEKLYSEPDLLTAYRKQSLVRVLAVVLFHWVYYAPSFPAIGVPSQYCVAFLRYQIKNWTQDALDLSNPGTRHAINLLDSASILGINYMLLWLVAVILEILALTSLIVRAVR